jgi:hypothetical protein
MITVYIHNGTFPLKYALRDTLGIDQFHVTAATMVQRSIGVKKRKQDVIAFVNTVTQFIHRGSYAHIVTVVRKFL